MARKTFLNGYPLPASDLNTYLMDQAVQTYADATARTAALPTPTEGMVSYLADTNTAYVYDGSSWNAVVDAKNYGSVLPNGSKNSVINGAFDYWQRGTTVASGGSTVYAADRWYFASAVSGRTMTRQSSGLTGFLYAGRAGRDSGNTSTTAYSLRQNFETNESLKFAGQTVTVSFYARAGANYSAASSGLIFQLKSGTGTDQNSAVSYTGEANVINQTATLTTTWQRFTYSGTVGSSATELSPVFISIPVGTAGAADYYEITGVQLELGSVATAFARAAGTLQGELAACQRYYYRNTPGNTYGAHCVGFAGSSTVGSAMVNVPVPMRVTPTSIEGSNLGFGNYAGAMFAISSVALNSVISNATCVYFDFASTAMAAGQVGRVGNNNNSAGYLGFNAEL